jgi:hypothetical protein
MSFYKDIKWDNIPIDKLLEVISIPSNPKPYVSPIAIDIQYQIFELLGINYKECTDYNIMLVHLPPQSKFTIHSDVPIDIPKGEGKLEQAVFFPLKFCEEVTWSWYKVNEPTKIFAHGEGTDYRAVPMVTDDAVTKIGITGGNKPMLTDIGTWHRLTNSSTESAYAISFRFMPWGWQPFNDCVDLPPIPNLSLL